MKARKLLNDHFGNIHIHIGHPLSLRSMASGKINRSEYNLTPRYCGKDIGVDLIKEDKRFPLQGNFNAT